MSSYIHILMKEKIRNWSFSTHNFNCAQHCQHTMICDKAVFLLKHAWEPLLQVTYLLSQAEQLPSMCFLIWLWRYLVILVNWQNCLSKIALKSKPAARAVDGFNIFPLCLQSIFTLLLKQYYISVWKYWSWSFNMGNCTNLFHFCLLKSHRNGISNGK